MGAEPGMVEQHVPENIQRKHDPYGHRDAQNASIKHQLLQLLPGQVDLQISAKGHRQAGIKTNHRQGGNQAVNFDIDDQRAGEQPGQRANHQHGQQGCWGGPGPGLEQHAQHDAAQASHSRRGKVNLAGQDGDCETTSNQAQVGG